MNRSVLKHTTVQTQGLYFMLVPTLRKSLSTSGIISSKLLFFNPFQSFPKAARKSILQFMKEESRQVTPMDAD